MADITMCKGVKCRSECPMKADCYRHTATVNPYQQSYFVTAPFEIDEDMTVTCEYFWQIENTDRLRKKDENG